MAKIAKKEKNDGLYRALLTLRTEEEVYSFFQDLCTVTELRAMEQRFQVARCLNAGMVYNEILAETGTSSATVSRVARSMMDSNGGYATVFERLENDGE